MNRTKGFTLVELLVVIAIIALLIGLLLPALAKARANAQSLKDKTQITQVHKAALGFATENKGRLPVPGMINRKPDTIPGGNPGSGPEDVQLNTSANLYSAMIAQTLFKPDLLIGTTEVNPVIFMKESYDFADFNPSTDSYWDTTFKVDPSQTPGPTAESNSSYSHLALMGMRKKNRWNNSQDGTTPCFSTRGTGGQYGSQPGLNGGAISGPEYTKSPTLDLHLPRNQWVGHVVLSDNHAETVDHFFPPSVSYIPNNAASPVGVKDNIFAAEFNDYPNILNNPQASADSWLGQYTVVQTSGNAGTPKFDALEP